MLNIANHDALTPRWFTLMAPFSQNQIIIFGGANQNNEYLSDGYVLDFEQMRIDPVFTGSANKIWSRSNQVIAVRLGYVAALVRDQSQKIYMVTYQEGDSQLTTIPGV